MNNVNSSNAADTIETGRAQRLVRLCGLTEPRARLIAGLAFGEVLA